MAHFWGISTVKNNIPEGIGDPKPSGYSLRAMVVKVCLFDVPEISVFEVVVVLAMVNPLLKHVALNDPG